MTKLTADLNDMEVGDIIAMGDTNTIMCVPGGWIFTQKAYDSNRATHPLVSAMTSCFVPNFVAEMAKVRTGNIYTGGKH